MATTRQIGSYNYGIAIANNEIAGSSQVEKFGKNPDLDTGVREDLIAQGGTWIPPTSASTYNFVSSSASDTAAGVGARTMTIYGLNGSYAEVSETLTLNGTTNVTTVNSYFIILRAVVNTVGTSDTNVGNITSVATGGGTPVGISILATKGQSQFGIYQVPAGYSFYLDYFDAGAQTALSCDIELYSKPFGGTWNLKGDLALSLSGDSTGRKTYSTPLKFTEKTLIKLTALTDINNCEVHGGFGGILKLN
jgi:hypothetical protein